MLCCAESLSRVWLSATPWTVAFQAPLVHGDSPGKNTGVGCHALFEGTFQPRSPTFMVDSLPSESPGKSKNTGMGSLSFLQWIFLSQELNQGFLHCRLKSRVFLSFFFPLLSQFRAELWFKGFFFVFTFSLYLYMYLFIRCFLNNLLYLLSSPGT